MHRLRHCSAGLFAVLAAFVLYGGGPSGAQGPQRVEPGPGDATFIVFMSGREVGRERVSVSRTADGWRIASSGRLAAPFNLTNDRFELTYGGDWQPIALNIVAQVQNRAVTLSTSFTPAGAVNEITQDGVSSTETDPVAPRTIVLPNNFFAAYEGLAVRLASAEPGATLPVYVAPQAEISATIKSVTPVTYRTPAGTLQARRYSVAFQNPDGIVAAEVVVDERHRLARVDLGSGVLSIAREDLAGVATREQTIRNPTDADVRIPASGFSLAGTITTPAAGGGVRRPAIVLVGGSRQVDRDSTDAGVPLFAQLAGQLAERGHVVLRYDKRGVGLSGGRTETVTLQDHADDALAAVRFLERRKDVDRNRIFVLGHGEGASIAMLAGREKRIDGLVLIAGMGTTGKELVLEQQRMLLRSSNLTGAEREDRIELQERILEAAVEDSGWDALPAEVRPLVDTPLYRSLLLFDPAQVMPRLRQPILIVQPGEDAQVPPHHAGRLAELARARRNAPPVEVKEFPGLDHFLRPAASEGGAAGADQVSPGVADAIAGWIATVARR